MKELICFLSYNILNKLIDFKKIYKLILLDQDKESLDEFYFNVIEQID